MDSDFPEKGLLILFRNHISKWKILVDKFSNVNNEWTMYSTMLGWGICGKQLDMIGVLMT